MNLYVGGGGTQHLLGGTKILGGGNRLVGGLTKIPASGGGGEESPHTPPLGGNPVISYVQIFQYVKNDLHDAHCMFTNIALKNYFLLFTVIIMVIIFCGTVPTY